MNDYILNLFWWQCNEKVNKWILYGVGSRMKSISQSIKKAMVLTSLTPILFVTVISVSFLYNNYIAFCNNWLENQNKVYESVITRYFNERNSDINTLASNLSIINSLESSVDGQYKKYLTMFMSNYEYESLVILDKGKSLVYSEYSNEIGASTKEALLNSIYSFSSKLDNSELGKNVFDYFVINGRLTGLLGKKVAFENGDVYYYFLNINNEHLNEILTSSSFEVEGAISYLVNKNNNGKYFFLTDVFQGNQMFNYGDISEQIPLYWKFASQNISNDHAYFTDLDNSKSLVSYSLIPVLGERLILISKIQVRYILSKFFYYFVFILFGLVLAFSLTLFVSKRLVISIKFHFSQIKNFCNGLISNSKSKEIKLNEYNETIDLSSELNKVFHFINEDDKRKKFEIRLESELRQCTTLEKFSSRSLRIIDDIIKLNFAAFYQKNDHEFRLLSQYFSSMDERQSLKSGIIAQCYRLNEIVQVKGTLISKQDGLSGAFVEMGSQAIHSKYYVFIPIIAAQDALHSGVIIVGVDKKLDKDKFDFIDKIRVNFAMVMSFVAQKENLLDLYEQTKKREDELHHLNKELTVLSRNDSLTGIYNRFYGEHLLQLAFENHSSLPLSILMFDIDHFKAYNDTYGHVTGDQCLSKVAQCIVDIGLRDEDFFFRYGGEEFMVVLPNTVLKDAIRVADRLRGAVQNSNILHAASITANTVTISVGVFTLTPEASNIKDLKQLIQKVDEQLYEAKKQRNTVFAPSLSSTN